MATTYEITVTIRANGRPVTGFPLTRRISCERFQDVANEHADDGAHTDLNTDYLQTYNNVTLTKPKLVFYTADQLMRFLGVTADAVGNFPLVLDSNGFILAVGLSTAAAQSYKTSNDIDGIGGDAPTANERIIVAGDD